MRIAFLHIGAEWHLPALMVRSLRRVMPDAEVIQMTEPETPNVPDIDTRIEAPYTGMGVMVYRLLHLANLGDDPVILLDTDVIVQRDLTPIFDHPFDVALTRRTGIIRMRDTQENVVETQPYNAGVMFSRSRTFWQDAAAYCTTLDEGKRKWFGDQIAIAEIVKRGKHKVMELQADEYNYTPEDEFEDMRDKAVIHYKGNRKGWMANRMVSNGRVGIPASAPDSGVGQWQTT